MSAPVVGLLSLELHFPGARSLKEKRGALRSIKDRLGRLNVTIAEVDHQGLWQRAGLAVVAVGSDRVSVERRLDRVLEEIERKYSGELVHTELDWLS